MTCRRPRLLSPVSVLSRARRMSRRRMPVTRSASGFTLYLPTGTEIGPQNRVVVRGKTYDVLGEPAEWVNPFTGWAPGVVVQTELTEG